MGVNGTMRFKLKTARNLFMLCLLMAVVYIMMFKIDTEIDCYKFCLRETCFGSRLAILVYRTDVKPKEMDFLQNYRPKIGYYKYAADHMSGEYDPETCSMEEHFSQFTTIPPQNNCAVVGNGGILLHSSCGAEINAYDYVIRMNLAPLRGYEEDVGVRTDITLLNFETLVYLHSNLTQRAMGDRLHDMYVNRVWYLNDSVLWYGKSMGPRETRKRLQQSVDVLKTTYQLPIRIAYSWRPLHPEKFIHLDSFATSGFNAYYVAQSLCKHVTLYGFYPSSKDKRGYHLPHHYHEDVPYEYNNRVHNLLSEFEKFKEFEAEGKVRIVTDKCAEGGRAMPRWRDGEEHEKPLGDLLWFKRNKP